MKRNRYRVLIRVPRTPGRVSIGILWLSAIPLTAALLVAAAILDPAWVSSSSWRGRTPVEALVALLLLVWVAGSSAAPFLAGRQTIRFEDGTVVIETRVPLNPRRVKRIPLTGTPQPLFHAINYPRDAKNPAYRPIRQFRVALGNPALEGSWLAPALTLAEAQGLAEVLNSVMAGRSVSATEPGVPWRIESVAD